ncbi:hypothetical protein BDA96_08G187000 [Sorghum bicolor]|uniref:Uncharacterized protein n=2 Tax=Sorghum bicolor TaxID=4558 RepID=A0A921QH19_SORBI|nr:hypothetical protein BDA96_08G187000 [Sorghum bicolor]OQU79600.1 hypothetical protein SORBI_3008G168866 [Sorghum bicolor]
MAPLELRHRRRRRQLQRKDQKEAMLGTSIHDLPDDRWRRVVTVTDGPDEGRAFLRLASSLHPPSAVGQYHNPTNGDDCWFQPFFSSHIDGSRFSVDKYWSVADCRGGLVLLRATYGPCSRSLPNLFVYDPLTRKRWSIPPPSPPNKQDYLYCFGDVFLLDGGDDSSNISISNFRVLCWIDAAAADDDDDRQACEFSTANDGEWDWLSVDVNTMEMRVLPEQTRNTFNYTLPWPQFLRACP